MTRDIAAQAQALERNLRGLGAFAVAFSGGLDSRFLIHMALRAGASVRALHATGPHVPSAEHAEALVWAKKRGVPLTVLPLDPLTMPALRNNPKDRCYHCKKSIFTAMKEAASGLPLADGTNASDFDGYRPGLKALAELGILSPLAEAGLSKADIRRIAAATGMDEPDQAARPCLLTRFAYGLPLTAEGLAAVDAAEGAVTACLRSLAPSAPPDFRLRYTAPESPVLHLALPGASLGPELLFALRAALAPHGLKDIPIEAVATLSGYFDRI